MKTLFYIGVSIVFMLSACNSTNATSTPETTKSNLPALTGNWSITMTHSGGIMGLMRSVEVNSTGSYTVKDDRGNQSFTGQLSEGDLANLIQVINSTTFSQNTKPYGCADCFVYDIQIVNVEGKFSAQVDDISIEESGLTALITTLRGIIERELK